MNFDIATCGFASKTYKSERCYQKLLKWRIFDLLLPRMLIGDIRIPAVMVCTSKLRACNLGCYRTGRIDWIEWVE